MPVTFDPSGDTGLKTRHNCLKDTTQARKHLEKTVDSKHSLLGPLQMQVKGIVQPKMKLQSLSTHPHAD